MSMKKKYYKEIIEQLEDKLVDQISQNHTIYERMANAEIQVIWLRKELSELSEFYLNSKK